MLSASKVAFLKSGHIYEQVMMWLGGAGKRRALCKFLTKSHRDSKT